MDLVIAANLIAVAMLISPCGLTRRPPNSNMVLKVWRTNGLVPQTISTMEDSASDRPKLASATRMPCRRPVGRRHRRLIPNEKGVRRVLPLMRH